MERRLSNNHPGGWLKVGGEALTRRARGDWREAAEPPEPGPQGRGGKLRLKNRGLRPAPGQQATPGLEGWKGRSCSTTHLTAGAPNSIESSSPLTLIFYSANGKVETSGAGDNLLCPGGDGKGQMSQVRVWHADTLSFRHRIQSVSDIQS